MNAVERLEAAITKLETLKVMNARTWLRGPHGIVTGIGLNVAHDDSMHEETADLIVTLHRTIDAQLAILRAVSMEAEFCGDGSISYYDEVTVDLADAILGGES